MSDGFTLRPATPADYEPIVEALGEWMPAETVRILLPRSYLQRFAATSTVAWAESGEPGSPTELAGFLVAFPSPLHPEVGYVHFVWVAPQFRGCGLGTRLHRHAWATLAGLGCTTVEAVCSPANHGAIEFHEALGFGTRPAGAEVDLPGGEDVVVLTRAL